MYFAIRDLASASPSQAEELFYPLAGLSRSLMQQQASEPEISSRRAETGFELEIDSHLRHTVSVTCRKRAAGPGRECPAEGDQREWRLEVDPEGDGNWSECNKYLKG
jgi:hypothetical protein